MSNIGTVKTIGEPNVQRLYETLARIIGKKYNVVIDVTVRKKKPDEKEEQEASA